MPRLLLLPLALLVGCTSDGGDETSDAIDDGPAEPLDLHAFDEVVFYDGYAALVDEPAPDDVQRLRNDLITRRLTSEEVAGLSDTLELDVVIGALCDNYDRIGNVSMALVPPGSSTYEPGEVTRIELGRFITPFMDKNVDPDEVPYELDASHTVPALRAAAEDFDLWVELEVFGVPYAANTEVRGCADRNDVFRGSLHLRSESDDDPPDDPEQLRVLAFKHLFNDYQDGASDALGLSEKTWTAELDAPTSEATLTLIVSNHGANAGGEEYERREHTLYVDGEPVLEFIPGRETCEPFRKYNTQPNGIYGSSWKSRATWQSFSNWCPGDIIDTRVVRLGALEAGPHDVVLSVPDAVFVDDQGYFPVSLYLQTSSTASR